MRPTPQDAGSLVGAATAPPAIRNRRRRRQRITAKAVWLPSKPPSSRAWWGGFNDPLLDSLIERAVSSNLDLRAAVLRIEEARAQRDISAAAFWPTLSADASYSRQRFSETTPTGSLFNSVGNVHLPGGASISVPNPYNQYQLSADASWELDLFGRIRRSVEAADASVQVSVEDQRAVLVSVLADVAQAISSCAARRRACASPTRISPPSTSCWI